MTRYTVPIGLPDGAVLSRQSLSCNKAAIRWLAVRVFHTEARRRGGPA